MRTQNKIARAHWNSYTSYILVTTGAVVGLGNLFAFPALVLKYGGLFVLFYLLCEIFLSIPLLFAELMIGRRGKQNPVGSISIVAFESNASPMWRYLGWLFFIVLFLTLCYYTVTASFPLQHILLATHDSLFTSHNHLFRPLILLEIAFIIFLFATLIIVARGINRGLETLSRIVVPSYFILLALLAIYNNVNGSFLIHVKHLFEITPTQAILPVFFAGLVFAFFKLNVGMGSMMVYGSYLPYYVPLVRSTLVIIILDILASLLAYFAVSPLILSSHLKIQEGLLIYQNVFFTFSSIPYGVAIAFIFFITAILLAWPPAIAMAESAVLTLIERWQISRWKSTALIGIGSLIIGTLFILTYSLWPEVKILSNWTIFGFIRNFTSDFLTPISAILLTIFVGWIVKVTISTNELSFYPIIYKIWQSLVRYLAPILILIVLILIGFN